VAFNAVIVDPRVNRGLSFEFCLEQ
jgi:hypothetical protein